LLDGKLFVYEGSELLDDFSINNGDEETRVESGNKRRKWNSGSSPRGWWQFARRDGKLWLWGKSPTVAVAESNWRARKVNMSHEISSNQIR
jgi:hypothetical protein